MATMTRIDRGSTATTAIYSEGGDLVFERTFDAPRSLVWRAFTDPELVPRWWGKHGTTTTIEEMDVRPGGRWRYVSTAPDRDDVAFYGEYLAVDPPAGFSWTFLFDVQGMGPQGGPEDHTFTEVDGGTLVRSVGHMGTPEVVEMSLATGMVEGALETWDRLEALLREL
ncbi:MAG TPA: SRPBCC domain-containing protein [Candidatus Limnocylindrales bacterium]|nr:SRPBCC domain-containing protein [Candidatus Limnocylindrales bacterium]